MSGGAKILWYVFGALTGWFVIWLAVMFGGVAVTAIASVFVVLFPIFAVIGLCFCLYVMFSGGKK